MGGWVGESESGMSDNAMQAVFISSASGSVLPAAEVNRTAGHPRVVGWIRYNQVPAGYYILNYLPPTVPTYVIVHRTSCSQPLARGRRARMESSIVGELELSVGECGGKNSQYAPVPASEVFPGTNGGYAWYV